jgi:protein associated with RNAse G/E
MYAVVKYFNYRKDVSLQVLKMFHSLEKAKEYAENCATYEYDEKIEEGVSQRFLELDDEVIEGYTKGDGYCNYVFTVLEMPEAE